MTMLCALMMGAGFVSCSDSEEDELIIDPIEKPNYILNEGHWGANNASVSMFNHPAFGIVQQDTRPAAAPCKLILLSGSRT